MIAALLLAGCQTSEPAAEGRIPIAVRKQMMEPYQQTEFAKAATRSEYERLKAKDERHQKSKTAGSCIS